MSTTIEKQKCNKIKRIYYDNDLENLPNQHELNSTNKDSIHPPQEATQIIFYFQDGKKKYITFWDDGYNNPLDRFPDKKIKPIFEEVTQLTKRISDSTGEKTIVPRQFQKNKWFLEKFKKKIMCKKPKTSLNNDF